MDEDGKRSRRVDDDDSKSATLLFRTRQFEREDIQKKTFTKWINAQLVKCNEAPIDDLFLDFREGTRLLILLGVLTGQSLKAERGKMRVHHINNVSTAIHVMEQEYNMKLVNISSNDIVDGIPKLTLALIWHLVLNFQMKNMLKDRPGELQQTNLERTLLDWCQHCTRGYANVSVTNFTSSFRDGLAFNALIHHYHPKLFSFDDLLSNDCDKNLIHAFNMADKHLGIETLLDAEDVNVNVPDKKSIMIYIMCLFQVLAQGRFNPDRPRSGIDFPQVLTRPASDQFQTAALPSNLLSTGEEISSCSVEETSASSSVASLTDVAQFQEALESILTWLLEAKDALMRQETISEDVQKVKEQFQEHEDFMMELTQHQVRIGQMLQRGNQLIREHDNSSQSGGGITSTEAQVSAQVSLLNTQWEELRTQAMTRQADLQHALTSLQQKQLDDLSSWLDKMEAEMISFTSEGSSRQGLDLGSIQQQMERHKRLQEEVEMQQEQVIGLHNMVVVVDDTNSDDAYTSLERQLESLGQRWGNICRWV